MSDPTINFAVKNNEQGKPFLSVQLDQNGLEATDNRVRFARLAMLYARQVSDSGVFPISSGAGDKVSATLTVTHRDPQGDGADFYEFSDDSDNVSHSDDYPEDATRIGCMLRISNLTDPDSRPMGWAASPAAQASTAVAKMLYTAIKNAAGVSHKVEAEGLAGPAR